MIDANLEMGLCIIKNVARELSKYCDDIIEEYDKRESEGYVYSYFGMALDEIVDIVDELQDKLDWEN